MNFNLPTELMWLNPPPDFQAQSNDSLVISAGAESDWFFDPNGQVTKSNAPVALFVPPDSEFMLSARVQVAFASTFDAGVFFLHESVNRWAKFCFEYSPQAKPTVVSVVTRGVSDDCNSSVIDSAEVCLRVTRKGEVFAYHYSLDGSYWNLVRYFTLGELTNLRVGFSAQSPTGQGSQATFSQILYREGAVGDFRNGE